MADTYLSRSITSTSSTWTFSAWIKRSGLGSTQYLIEWGTSSGNGISFSSSDKIQYYAEGSGSNPVSTMLFRDTNAWYHIVVRNNAGTLTFYVNGETITMSSGAGSALSATTMRIGDWRTGAYHFDGIMSHVHFIDGTAYAASTFGSTDATTGEWKINTNPSVTYGSDGFFILKDGNSVTDQSGNSNNFTVGGGTLTKTEDCPSNIFCTLNPLQKAETGMSVTYSFGNTKYAGNSSNWQRAYGTIGANTGKFFYEFKVLNVSGTSDQLRVGWDSISSINNGTDNYYSGLTIDTAGKLRGGEDGYSGYDPDAVQMTAAYSGGNFSFTTGDILGMAIDIDNNTFSVYKNGYLEINAYSYASASNCSLLKSKGHFIGPSVNWYSTSGNANRSCFNFGNGYFETTAISSAGTNASGIGLFEYDVPANYTAFATKGLNE